MRERAALGPSVNQFQVFTAQNVPQELRDNSRPAVLFLIIYAVFRIVKRDFIFIIALVILVPSSIPVLKSIWSGLAVVIKYLFNLAGH